MLIDTHCHLDFPEFDRDRDEVVARAAKVQVGCIINVGSSLEGSRRSVELSRQYPGVYAVVGIHPHEADEFKQGDAEEIKKLALQEKVVAIGEIGLDYFLPAACHPQPRILHRDHKYFKRGDAGQGSGALFLRRRGFSAKLP